MAIQAFELYGDVYLKGGQQTKNDLDDIDRKGKKAGSTMGGKLAKGAGIAAKAFGAAALAAGTFIVKLGVDSIKAYSESEAAGNRLATIMRTVTKATDEQIESIKIYAAELQKTTVVEDDAAIAGASQLASFGANEEALKTLMPAMNDLAVAQYGVNVSQEQMIQTANMMGKALEGQVGALTRAGVLVSDEYAKALEEANTKEERAIILTKILNDNYGGLATTAAETAEGGMQQLKNAWGDMQEALGEGLIPVQQKFIDLLQENMPEIQDTMENVFDAIVPVLESLMDDIFPALNDLLPIFADFFTDVVAPALEQVMPLFTTLAETLLPPIMEILGVLVETILPPLVEVINMIFEALGPVLDVIAEMVSERIMPMLNKYYEALLPLLQAFFDLLGPILDALMPVVDLFLDLAEDILPVVVGLVQMLTPLLELLAPAIKALAIPIAVVVDALRLVIESIKWIINNAGALLGLNDYQEFGFDFENTATEAAIKNLTEGKKAAEIKYIPGNASMTPGKASGGPIIETGKYLVGELGPELVTLPQGAHVSTADETEAMRGDTYNIQTVEKPTAYEIIRQAQKSRALAWALR